MRVRENRPWMSKPRTSAGYVLVRDNVVQGHRAILFHPKCYCMRIATTARECRSPWQVVVVIGLDVAVNNLALALGRGRYGINIHHFGVLVVKRHCEWLCGKITRRRDSASEFDFPTQLFIYLIYSQPRVSRPKWHLADNTVDDAVGSTSPQPAARENLQCGLLVGTGTLFLCW